MSYFKDNQAKQKQRKSRIKTRKLSSFTENSKYVTEFLLKQFAVNQQERTIKSYKSGFETWHDKKLPTVGDNEVRYMKMNFYRALLAEVCGSGKVAKERNYLVNSLDFK